MKRGAPLLNASSRGVDSTTSRSRLFEARHSVRRDGVLSPGTIGSVLFLNTGFAGTEQPLLHGWVEAETS